MPKESAGLLMFRIREHGVEFLLVHPGGPFWKKKDAGAWTIPKGEVQPGEDPAATARREFQEELGFPPGENLIELAQIKQKGGKTVRGWAFQGDCDLSRIRSNTFSMEWPPRSGQMAEFPEVDKAAFFGLEEAKLKINPAQVAFLTETLQKLGR